MKDDADKVSCHPSRRGGSEHQPGEGFTATRFCKAQILSSPIGEHRANRTYCPRSPRGMPIFACWKLTACPGRARLCGYGSQCLLCGEDSMRHSRANLAKGTIRFLRQREIGGKLPLLLIWSAMLKTFLDCKRGGRRAEAGSETTRACDG
jgi:hypothetical protein